MNKFSQIALDVWSDQQNSGTDLVGVSELSCPVAPQDRCYFSFNILFQQSSQAASVKLDLSFPQAPANIVYNISIPAASAGADTMSTSSNRACSGTTVIASVTDYLANITGVLINGINPGVLQPQFATTGLGAVTVRAGSSVIMTNL